MLNYNIILCRFDIGLICLQSHLVEIELMLTDTYLTIMRLLKLLQFAFRRIKAS